MSSEKDKKIAMPSEEEIAKYAPDGNASVTGEENGLSAAASGDGGEATSNEPVESLRAQLEEYKDKALRAQAECANIAKRLHQQHADTLKYAASGLARALLPVIDNFRRTLQSMDESKAEPALVEGVRLIAEQFSKILREQGIEPIEAVGAPFDPMLHEAMMQDAESDQPAGTVTQELERGYKIHDRVLRPAKVAVAVGQEPTASEGRDSDDGDEASEA